MEPLRLWLPLSLVGRKDEDDPIANEAQRCKQVLREVRSIIFAPGESNLRYSPEQLLQV